MPLGMVRRRAPAAIILPGNPAEYERVSIRLLEILRATAPVTEAASLDDFYLDLTGCEQLYGGNLLRWGARLARQVRGEMGMPLSFGLASNKMLARIATCLAKPGHGVEVFGGHERDFLAPVSVRLLPGVGRVTQERLREFGVQRIGQLAELGEDMLRLLFGSNGTELWRRARGEFYEAVKPTALHRRIIQQHVFIPDTADPVILEAAAALLAQKLAWELRRNSIRSACVDFALIYSDGISVSHRLAVGYPLDQDHSFIGPARDALPKLFRRRVRVRQISLRADFVPCEDSQYDLFQEKAQCRNSSLYRAMDRVRSRHGFMALLSARTLFLRDSGGTYQRKAAPEKKSGR